MASLLVRRSLTLMGVAGLLATALTFPAGASAAPSGPAPVPVLAGFDTFATASPLQTLIDDPANAIPRNTGVALLEADPAYTQASFATGPNARAIASSLWPGNLVGEGLSTATMGAAPAYPLKEEAKYPDRPLNASDPSGLFVATASKDEALAQAGSPARTLPGVASLAAASSESRALVPGAARAHASSVASGVSLLLGTVTLDSVTTTLDVSADGRHPSAQGTTVVAGLTVAGVGYTVSDAGVRPTKPPLPGLGPLSLAPLDPASQLGLSFAPPRQASERLPAGIEQTASGLTVSVDTHVFRAALTTLTPTPVQQALQTLVGQTPDPLKGQLYYLLRATPHLTFLLGRASVRALASLPLTFSFPPAPSFPAHPGILIPGHPGTSLPGSPGSPGTLAGQPGSLAPALPGSASAGAPALIGAAPGLLPLARATEPGFAGIPWWLLALALGFAGIIGRGFMWLQALGTGTPGRCTLGRSTRVPRTLRLAAQ